MTISSYPSHHEHFIEILDKRPSDNKMGCPPRKKLLIKKRKKKEKEKNSFVTNKVSQVNIVNFVKPGLCRLKRIP